jgi:hypothetical protein
MNIGEIAGRLRASHRQEATAPRGRCLRRVIGRAVLSRADTLAPTGFVRSRSPQ